LIRTRRIKDFELWYQTGQRVVANQSLYPADGVQAFPYMYPPFPAIFLYAPLSALGFVPLVTGITFLTLLAWPLCVIRSVHLVAGNLKNAHPLLYILPTAATAPYVWDNFFLGQPNLLLLALILSALTCLRYKRSWTAGALIAAATAIKAFPLLLLPYLIYRRYWKAAISMIAFLVTFLLILPAPIRGFSRNANELWTWFDGM